MRETTTLWTCIRCFTNFRGDPSLEVRLCGECRTATPEPDPLEAARSRIAQLEEEIAELEKELALACGDVDFWRLEYGALLLKMEDSSK